MKSIEELGWVVEGSSAFQVQLSVNKEQFMPLPMFGPVGESPKLPSGGYAPLSPGFATENLIFLSGQLPFKEDGSLDIGSIESQTAQCLANIKNFLDAHNLDRKDIVKVTVWLTDVADFAGFNGVYSAFFGDTYPARSTVRSDLMLPGARVEIECIVAKGKGAK